MRISSNIFGAGIVLAAAVMARPAGAAAIVWQAPVTVSSPSDVSTDGTLYAAISANDSAVTVNGVSFSGYLGATSLIDASGLARGSGAGLSPNLTDAAYNQLLFSAAYKSVDVPDAIQIEGLTVGRTYEVQIWTPFWDANWATSFVAGNTSDALNVGVGGARPQYVIGSFVADGSDETIGITGQKTYRMFAALQVRELAVAVPEPATWWMMIAGFGIVGAAQRRRRTVVA
jgi:hypothetical protein